MATWTKATLADRVLENIGVKPAGNSASAGDTELAEEAVDVVHDQLRKLGLAPFATSAIPTWAQFPLRDLVSEELTSVFQISGQRLLDIQNAAQRARMKLAEQVSGRNHGRVKLQFF